MFIVAHHFLWGYPDNAESLATRFGINEKYARGEHLWLWIKKIAALKSKKIVWPKRFDEDNSEIFIISVDGTDCAIWEPKHGKLPKDKKFFSKKKNRAGVKYLVAISVYGAQCVFIDGPFEAGHYNDIEAFRKNLKGKIRAGKKAVVDGGFPPNPKSKKELNMLALPRPGYGGKEFRNFKARVRCRHETFNSRLKFYSCLSQLFRHGMDKHGEAFTAICVTVQYEMDNGAPIYNAVHHDVGAEPRSKRRGSRSSEQTSTKKRSSSS